MSTTNMETHRIAAAARIAFIFGTRTQMSIKEAAHLLGSRAPRLARVAADCRWHLVALGITLRGGGGLARMAA